jgi:arginine decarboxylase
MYIETPQQYYRIPNWGVGYFKTNKHGHLCVHPQKNSDFYINLYKFVKDNANKGIKPPYSISFPQILGHSIRKISNAFLSAKKEFDFSGGYTPVFPIKVNQNKNVVQHILAKGKEFGIGLEAGTKTELAAVLCVADKNTTVVCNGYKDKDYIQLIVSAEKICKQVFVVIEKFSELTLLKQVLDKNRNPENLFIGIRARLNTRGSGKWEESGGDFAKFGLTAAEIVEAIDFLQKNNLLNLTKMLHVHIGSQITNTSKIKDMAYEAGFLYAEMKKTGVPLDIIDFGGGLAVDYDGSRSSAASSSNYTVSTYANNLVFHLSEVCKKKQVPEPHIFTESGRAFTAHHSLIVVNAFDKTSVYSDRALNNHSLYGTELLFKNELLKDLKYTLDSLNGKNLHEYFQDAIHYKEQIHTLFKMGMLSLREKAVGEQIFWAIVKKAASLIRKFEERPEGLEDLEKMLASKYICNFSIFNSIPDSWAIKQLFPIAPIHRLDEMPQETATLADITCDSDGKIERFVDVSNVRSSIKLHRPNGKPYYLGIFLTGAYQKVLGNLHNLLNSPFEFWINVEGEDKYSVISRQNAKTVEETLCLVGYDANDLKSKLSAKEFQTLLQGSTYLQRDYEVNKEEALNEISTVFYIKDIACHRCLDELKIILDDFPAVKEYHVNTENLNIKLTLSKNSKTSLIQLLNSNGFNVENIK